MKKIFSSAIVAITLVTLFACHGNKQTSCNTKICDYLYGVEYDDYDFDSCVILMEKRFKPSQPACSEVRKGNFVGRNLDWYINCDASAIIKINASEKRLASIGMVGSNPNFTNELAQTGKYDNVYKMLPFFTVDGLNEKGLYIGVNVMPTGETSLNKESWEANKWGHGAAFTNPSSDKTYCVTYLVRVVLDQAKSVEEAKNLITSINWYEPMGFPHEGCTQSFHWLIADSTSNTIVEFIDNKPYFTETTEVSKPSYATIMTNFTNALMDKEKLIQNHGAGYERWNILAEKYDSVPESFEGIEGLMKNVWYSLAYTKKMGSKDFFTTEFASDEFPSDSLLQESIWENENFIAYMNGIKQSYTEQKNWHTAGCGAWYTTHTSLYDIKNLKMKVLVHEGMDEQKEFYAADFDTKFEKPLK